MSKRFTIITKNGSKWLQPINVPYPNADDYEDGNEPHPEFARADAVIYEERTRPVPYIGSKPVGSTVDESEVMEVRQMQYEGKWIPAEEDLIDFATLTTRTVFTDAESHDRHISDDYPGIDYQPLFNHMSKVHGLTLTTGEMDEIIGLSTYILSKK